MLKNILIHLSRECMSELYSNFQGYLQLNMPRIKGIIILGLLFYVLYCLLWLKGYTRKYKNVMATMMWGIILSLDCSFIFVMTLLGREIGDSYHIRLKPFQSYFLTLIEGEMEILLQILVNIAMYIPIGFLLPCCFEMFERYRRVMLVGILTSLCIEVIQFILKIGMFEVDDIISNTLGCIIGLGLWLICEKMFLWYKGVSVR